MKKMKIGTLILFLFLSVGMLSAQGVTVTGIVLDENSEELPMANIKIVGAKTGTVTDMMGNFTIKVPNEKSSLEFSYVGYQKKVVQVKGKTKLTVRLEPDSKMLGDVVIVGFGVQRRANATGAVKTIDNAAIESRPITNAAQGLQGVVAGLNISNDAGGAPGQSMNINIRGVGSIGEGSDASPLVLIDGIEGDLSTVNPNDIENVSVLKDAAAASIYGSRAPFGVILVTTKGGEKGLQVNYSGNIQIKSPSNVPQKVDSWTFANMVNDANRNAGQGATFGSGILQKMLDYQAGMYPSWTEPSQDNSFWLQGDMAWGNTDWYAEHLRSNTYSQEHNLTVSGGGDKVTYYFSGSFMNQNGLFKYADDFYNRLSLNAKVNVKLLDNLTFNLNTRFVTDENNKPTSLDALFFHSLGKAQPTVGVMLPNGEYYSGSLIPALQNGGREIKYDQTLYNQASVIYEPLKGKGWKIYGDFGARIENPRNTRQMKKLVATMPDGSQSYFAVLGGVADKTEVRNDGTFLRQAPAGTSYYEVGNGYGNYINTNLRTDYELKLDDHELKFLIGMQTEYYYKEYTRTSSDAIANDDAPFLPKTAVNGMISNKMGEWSNFGAFARVNYAFANRYMLELNFRADGASRFPSHQRWATFPAVSLGWNVAEEPFFEPVKDWGFDMLKFRGSYGYLGNQKTTSFYPYFQEVKTDVSNYVMGDKGAGVIWAPQPFSTSLTWENIENAGVGLDFALLSGRITGALDWYQRTTKDMVGPSAALPAVFGATAPPTNNAELRTRGWEVELAYQDRIGKDWSYNISVVLSDYESVVTQYDSPDGALFRNNLRAYYPGMQIGDIWGYRTVGIAQSDLEMSEHLKHTNQTAIIQPWVGGIISDRWGAGDVMYKDLNGDNQVTAGAATLADHGDLEVIGNDIPHYTYGIRGGAKWRFIDFSFFFQGVGKREFDLGRVSPFFGIVAPYDRSLYVDHLDYWRPAGDALGYNPDAYYPRLRTDNNNHMASDRYLQDASYLRLKNVQLGVTLPKGPWSSVIKTARLYFSGENLLTFTKLRVFDPEALGNGGGWGNGKTYPMYSTYSIGLSITL